ncbi:MAG: cytochrome c3 family protein [Planctomycetota bacterium]
MSLNRPPVGWAPALVLAGLLAAQDPPQKLNPQESCTANCHQDLVKDDFVHKPLAEGKCIACHKQPEATAHEFEQIDDINESCAACHEAKDEGVIHPPYETMDCTTCHSPHHGKTKGLLSTPDVLSLCATCHGPVKESLGKPFVHGPVADGDCLLCHDAHSAPEAKLLQVEPIGLCGKCHSELTNRMDEAESVHAPASFDCLQCHDAHAADHEFQLKKGVPDLCLSCHKPLAESLQGSATPHGALTSDRKCLNCHRPHESANAKLLEKPQRELCSGCHEKAQERAGGGEPVAAIGALIASMKVLHGPIRDGECTPCHQPHVSPNQKLLQKGFAPRFYAPFEESNYELCFSCHDKKVFETPETTELTGFRNGDKNLHFVHVNDPRKGRTCRACHEIHGANQPKMLATSVPFGNWQLPIRWQGTDDGGSCAPACHKPRSYARGAPSSLPGK